MVQFVNPKKCFYIYMYLRLAGDFFLQMQAPTQP